MSRPGSTRLARPRGSTRQPHGNGSRHKLLKGDDGSEYSDLHGVYHASLSGLVSARDYYDLFLVDPDGNIVYTVFKEDELGTNLLRGALNGAPIAGAYREAVESPPGTVVGTGFARFAPSKNIPAAFVGTSLHHDGRFAGALLCNCGWIRSTASCKVRTAWGTLSSPTS